MSNVTKAWAFILKTTFYTTDYSHHGDNENEMKDNEKRTDVFLKGPQTAPVVKVHSTQRERQQAERKCDILVWNVKKEGQQVERKGEGGGEPRAKSHRWEGGGLAAPS